MPDQIQEVTKEETIIGTTKFGLGQISKPTPLYVTWIFRIVLYLCSVGTIIVSTDRDIPDHISKKISTYLAIAVLATHGASKLFGVSIDENEFKK